MEAQKNMGEKRQRMPEIKSSLRDAVVGFLESVITIYCTGEIIEDLEMEEFAKDLSMLTSTYLKLLHDGDLNLLSDEEIVDLYWNIDCQLFNVIREDRDIDNIIWLKSIIDVYCIIKEYIKANDISKIWD